MNIVFRFNAGGDWGHGHLYRNIALMDKMKDLGHSCFAIVNDCKEALSFLDNHNCYYKIVEEHERPQDLLKAIALFNLVVNDTVIFFDRIDSEEGFYQYIRHEGYKIISYDDDGPYSYDANIVIKARPLQDKNVHDCYSGFEYQIIRNEFLKYAELNKQIQLQGRRVVVHFGGTDPLGLLKKTFYCLEGENNIELLFISGLGAYDEELAQIINNKENMHYVAVADDFALELFNADVAIISGGVTAYECGAIGTPMILIAQNEDQLLTQRLLSDATGCNNLGIGTFDNFKKLKPSLFMLLNNEQMRLELSQREKQIFSKDGITSICKIISGMENMICS